MGEGFRVGVRVGDGMRVRVRVGVRVRVRVRGRDRDRVRVRVRVRDRVGLDLFPVELAVLDRLSREQRRDEVARVGGELGRVRRLLRRLGRFGVTAQGQGSRPGSRLGPGPGVRG